jgi:hypothetical protein
MRWAFYNYGSSRLGFCISVRVKATRTRTRLDSDSCVVRKEHVYYCTQGGEKGRRRCISFGVGGYECQYQRGRHSVLDIFIWRCISGSLCRCLRVVVMLCV